MDGKGWTVKRWVGKVWKEWKEEWTGRVDRKEGRVGYTEEGGRGGQEREGKESGKPEESCRAWTRTRAEDDEPSHSQA